MDEEMGWDGEYWDEELENSSWMGYDDMKGVDEWRMLEKVGR